MTERHEERLKEAVWASTYRKDLRDAISAALDEIERLRGRVAELENLARELGATIDG